MADDLGFVPSTPAKDDLGFIPHPIATKGNDNLGFIPSPTYKPPASSIQPGPGAVPLSIDQNPQGSIQAGPATRNPAEEAERPKGSGDWLMDAITAPGTFIGSLFHPHVPTKEELSQEKVIGAPAQVNLPLIDPSVGMDPTFMKGIVRGIGGLTTPSQLPLTLFSPESKALSGLFAAMTVPQLGIKATEYQELKSAGKDAEANVVLGEMATMGALGTLATYHASGYAEHLATTKANDVNSQRLALLSSLPPERQINVLKDMGVIPKDVDLESLMPSMARAKSGNLQIGADIGSLTQILGSSMYSNRGAPVVVKELLQNALDAVRSNGGGVEANLDRNDRTFTIKDTGVGMTPDEVYSVFTDIGASGKRLQAGASGGFGLAKIAPFMIPERMTVETTAHDTSTGKNITTSFASTPEDIVSGNVKPKVTYSPADTPTGTSIKTYFPEPKPEQGYDPHSFYDAEKFLRNFLGSSNLPTSNIKFKSGGADLEGMRDPVRESFTLQGPGGFYTFSLGDKVAKGESYPEYEVHNNGLYQFTTSNFVPGADKVSLPTRIVVDVKPNVREGATDYPFTTNREGTTSTVKTFVSDAIKSQLVAPKLQEVNDLVKAKYNNMPMLDLPDGGQMPIYDSGARLTVDEINTLRTSPAMLDISKVINSVFRTIQSHISNLPATLFGGLEKRPMGSTVGRIGILLADTMEHGGARTYGVYVPDPSNPANQASVFINPFGWASLAEEGVKPYTSQEMGLFYNPDFAASQLYHTMVHELTHDVAKGHNEAFTTGIMNLDSFLGINAKIGSLEDIANAFRDPNDPSSIRSDFDELLSIYRESRGRPENEKDILGGESLSTRRQQPPKEPAVPPTPDAQVDREKALWNDLIAARGRGLPQEPVQPGSIPQGAGGEAAVGELRDKLKGLVSILPDFTKAIGGGEEKAARPDSAVAGATGILGSNEPPPPVISRAVDDDMAAGGIQVQHKGQDVNLGIRALGSLIEKVRALKRDGHPLGDILYAFTSKGSDAIKAIMRNTGDSMKSFINGSYKLVNDDEWSNQVVDIMNNGITDLPAGTPDHVWDAAQHAQVMVEAERVKTRDAKRAELHIMKPNLPMTSDDPNVPTITKFYPDDWGLKGRYYPHAHPGTWAISQLTGVDERGNNIWEPIDGENTSWRAVSEFAAKNTAEKWLSSHPNATIRVKQDTISASASNLTDRARLKSLLDKVGDATETIAHGGDPDDVMDQLYNQASAAAYGPRSAAKRQWGSAMRRETDLQGFSRDIEDFKDHLVAGERYAVLAPVRQEMMKIRNQVAKLAGAGQVQSPSDFPNFKFPPQYANILGRMDSFIEGLEGTPGLADATMKYLLNSVGADPNLGNKVMAPVQQLWALMKLGFNPARLLSHGSQSIWAVNTVLGMDATIKGYAHSYDPAYNWLVHDLAIEHAGNMSDLEGFREYAGAYFGRGNDLIDWTKGGLKTVRDLGLSPLVGGIHFSSRVAAIGAYIQGLERGMESPQARDYARDVLDRTMGVYHAADNPALFRQLPSTVTQFKGFMAKTGQFIFGLRGAEIPRFLAAAVLIGGVSAAGIAQLSSLIHLATGGESIADYLKRKYPTYARGIFGLIGLDVPSAVGPGDFSLYKTNAPLGGVAGPLWSDIITAGKAGIEQLQDPVRRSASQDLDATTRVLSPQARRVWDEATRMASTPSSVDPRTGSVILEHLTPLERLEMGLGFTPLRVAEERESHEYVRNLITNEKDRRGFIVDHMAANAIKLSQSGLTHDQQMNIMKDTIAMGRMAAEYGVGAGLPKAVMERAREMQLERLHRDYKLAPRAVRPQIYQEMQRFQEENP